MRHRTYLNVILTVNGVLLAGLLWTQIAGAPLLAGEANAQQRSTAGPPVPTIPNASRQREATLQATRDLNKKMDDVLRALRSGDIKVEVTNLDKMEVVVKER